MVLKKSEDFSVKSSQKAGQKCEDFSEFCEDFFTRKQGFTV